MGSQCAGGQVERTHARTECGEHIVISMAPQARRTHTHICEAGCIHALLCSYVRVRFLVNVGHVHVVSPK